jgi:hypothetical protein
MDANRGILFVATGDAYVAEAVETAQQIATSDHDYPVALVTDSPVSHDVFDEVVLLEEPEHTLTDKVSGLQRSPFERTVFLDTDTHIVDMGIFDDLWAVLERTSIAAAFDIARSGKTNVSQTYELTPPPTFPMLNTGVLVFDRPETASLFDRWEEIHNDYVAAGHERINDQIAFRQALWESAVTHTILPPEYNFIVPSPQFAADDVRLLHGDIDNYDEVERMVNESTPTGGRVYHPVYSDSDRPAIDPWVAGANEKSFWRLFRRSVRDIGVVRTTLYSILGGDPNEGSQRAERFFQIVDEEGLPHAVKKVWQF